MVADLGVGVERGRRDGDGWAEGERMVGLDVCAGLGAEPEAGGADGAEEGSAGGVDDGVATESGGSTEALSAVRAKVRASACVHSDVLSKVLGGEEGAAALDALVGFLGSIGSGMLVDGVVAKVALVFETSRAVRAEPGLGGGVDVSEGYCTGVVG